MLKFIDEGINWMHKQRSQEVKYVKNWNLSMECRKLLSYGRCILYSIEEGHVGNMFNINEIKKIKAEFFQGKVKCADKSMLIKPRGPMINGCHVYLP